MKESNNILRMWALLVCTLLVLVGMYYLPERIGGWEIKPIDILSDLRTDAQDSLEQDPEKLLDQNLTTYRDGSAEVKLSNEVSARGEGREHAGAVVSEAEQARLDSLYQRSLSVSGLSSDSTFVPIEDYTAGHVALSRYYNALQHRNNLGRPVRIVVLGDSFIEGDIFTAPLRKSLQDKFGGGGVGWMPLSSTTAGYRTSVRHEFSGWTEQSVLGSAKKGQTFSGYYFTGHEGSRASYSLPRGSHNFDRAVLYYVAPESVSLSVKVADSTQTYQLAASSSLQEHNLLTVPTSSFKMSLLSGSNGLKLYGLALEANQGVTVDNMSLRGNSGHTINGIDESLTTRFCELRAYDLIILQYGLNVANDKQKDYSNYAKTLKGIISRLRQVSPKSDILVMSVSDRAKKTSSGVETMKSIFYLHSTQQEVAREMGCAFWSTLKAMRSHGGIGAMVGKGQAAKDYTHLTHKGGVDVAQQFVKALTAEQRFRESMH